MEYNKRQKTLAMPEYGRNVQNMVDYCLTLADREERNRCARTIIHTMHDISPERRSVTQNDNTYWDHLAIMSEFRLDVDYPADVITEEKAKCHPASVPYNMHKIQYRFYGYIIQQLVEKAVGMEEGVERTEFAKYIATQMKRAYLAWNKDYVEDVVIFRDLFDLSGGKLLLSPTDCVLRVEKKTADNPAGKPNNNKKRLRFKRKGQ